MNRNKQTPAGHKMQGPEDGVWEKTATKPSPEVPFDSVVTPTRSYEPRPPQGFRTVEHDRKGLSRRRETAFCRRTARE